MIIQIPNLNNNQYGRFGNQLFKYLFLKVAQSHFNCKIQHPDWIGSSIFEIAHPPPSFTTTQDFSIDLNIDPDIEREIDLASYFSLIKQKSIINQNAINLTGYFQLHTSRYINYQNFFFDLFIFKNDLKKYIEDRLIFHGLEDKCFAAIHMQLGDYKSYSQHPYFWMPPPTAIALGIKNIIKSDYIGDYIYACSDDLESCKDFFQSIGVGVATVNDLFPDANESAKLLIDFYMMAHSNINIISNSSLSFFASMMNKKASIFLRPSPDSDEFIPFDPWNSHVLLKKIYN